MFPRSYFPTSYFTPSYWPIDREFEGSGATEEKKRSTRRKTKIKKGKLTEAEIEGLKTIYGVQDVEQIIKSDKPVTPKPLTEITSSKVIDSARYKEYIELVEQQRKAQQELTELQEEQEIGLILALIQKHVY